MQAELVALADAGCAEIAIDEPSMSCYAHREDPERLVDLFNRTVAPVVGRARLSTHLCFGNYKGRAVAPRQYAPLFPAFLGVDVDEIHLEMASRELAEAELVGTIAETKDVAVGVIDVKSYYVETPEDVAARVRRFAAAGAAGAARLLDRLRPQPDGALGGEAEAREPRRRRPDRPRRAVIEPSTAGTHVWWLGQSGFLIGHEGRHLLVDPYLSDSLTAKYEGTETPHVRMHPHVVAPEQLAFVDVVLSTHGHTDHLDGETLRAIGAPLVAPAGIVELARERSGGEVTGDLGGRDDRGRRLSRRGRPGRASRRALRRLRDRGGRPRASTTRATRRWVDPGVRGVDVAFLPINGKLGNLDGPEAARLAQTVDAALAVPCHYDMFEFNTASPDAFVAECERLGQPYRVLRQGERLTLD